MVAFKGRVVATLAVLAVGFGASASMAASPPGPRDTGLENVDLRAAGSVPAKRRAARTELERALGPMAEVRSAPQSGAVAYVGRPTGLLTGPSSDDPRDIALDYVREHGEAFGLTKADFANLRPVARDVSPDGVTHLRLNQVLDGIESFDSGIEAHVTADGRLVNLSGGPLPEARLTTTKPTLDAFGGLSAARRAARSAGCAPREVAVKPGPSQVTTFAGGEQARLRWVATADGPVLAWQVITEGADGHSYDVLVDAADGALLRRQDLTQHLGESRYFARDPDRTPAPTTLTMPPAWYDDSAGGTRLWGQFSRTYGDPAGLSPAGGGEGAGGLVQVPASAGAPSSPDWLFAPSQAFPGATPCPATGCTWDSASPATAAVNQSQAGSNLHVLVSRFHDYLVQAPIGFNEASGNFQRTNTSGAGLGNDYVRSEFNDGVNLLPAPNLNNANMSTPPDGLPPRMQMFMFSIRDVNGSDVADVVYHEYTHGLTNRLVVNAGGSSTLSSIQARMMGEAWSDFYGLDLQVAEGSATDTPAPAEVSLGDYAFGPPGVRAKPIDCPVNPAGVAGCNGHSGIGAVPGGYTYGDLAVTNNASPHAGGQVWAETLWDIRTAVGHTTALALITGGLRLSVDNPSMLDMREAILQQAVAMRSAPGAADDHYATLWTLFAARGMGASARTPSAGATNPTEAYDAPRGVRARSTAFRDPYPGGDNDGLIEPGERFLVDQSLEGIGPADVSGIVGTLTSGDPAVVVEDGTAAWPVVGLGRQAVNSDELAARLPAGSCRARSPLSINVSSSGASATATAVLDPRPASTTVVALADAASSTVPRTTQATFTVASGGPVADVDLRIDDLSHTWLGELSIELVHDGVAVAITNRFGNPAFSGDDIIEAVFDDAAPALPGTATAPVTGRVRPAGSLAAFNGRPAAGIWTLRITDHVPLDTGELRRWGLNSPQVACGRAEIPVAATGDPTGVGPSEATLRGTVTPNGRATGLRFSYGTTSAYGTSTTVENLGAGDAQVARGAALQGLAPSTTYHYRVEAIRENGVVAVAGADRTFTTPPLRGPTVIPPPALGGMPSADTTPPKLGRAISVKLGRASRRTNRRRTTLRFTLSEPASVRVALTRAARGVRKGRSCVAPRRRGKRCRRRVPAGTKTQAFAKAGAAELRLSPAGLRKGTYTAKLVATDAARNRSAARVVRFRVR